MKRILSFLLLFSFSSAGFAENLPISVDCSVGKKKFLIEIPLVLSASDKRTGIQLKPRFTVKPSKGGNPLPIKELDGQMVAMVQKGESYIVKVEADGYYTSEKTYDIDSEDVTAVIQMDPQPSAIVNLKAIDENFEPMEASFRVKAGEKVYTGKVSKTNPVYKLILVNSDNYEIEVSALNYKTIYKKQQFEVGDPPRTYTIEPFRLEKPGNTVRILVVGADNEKILRGVKIVVMNVSDNALVMDNLLPEGEAQVELISQKKYSILLEQPGYVSIKQDLKGNSREQTFRMKTESYISLSAFDALTGKRLPAIFKIKSSKGDKVVELKGATDADVRFKPTEAGVFEIETVLNGYKKGSGSVNIENLSGGKTPFNVNLESAAEEYVFLVVDYADREQAIVGADVKISDTENRPVSLKFNSKTGEWKAVLEKDKDYKVFVTAPDYQPIKGEAISRSGGKLLPIKLRKVVQEIQFTAIDALTKKSIPAIFKVIRPDQEPLTTKSTTVFKMDIYPQRSYILEVSAENYKTKTENLSFKPDFTEKDGNRIIELERNFYTYNFKVLDSKSKKAVQDTKFRILNLATNQPVTIKSEKEGIYSADLVAAGSYSVEADAEGYEKNAALKPNFVELASNNKFDQEIILSKLNFEKIKFSVVDDEKRSKILNSDLSILNSKGEAVELTKNPLGGEWSANLKNEETYTFEAKANGFILNKGDLTKNKSQEIKLKRIPSQEIVFSVVDELTQKPIVSDFKLSAGNENIEGKVIGGGSRYRAGLLQDKKYELEVKATGYAMYKEAVNNEKVADGVIAIQLKKDAYTFYFKAIDGKTQKMIGKTKFKCVNASNETIPAKYLVASNEYEVELKPNEIYSLTFEADNYKPMVQSIDVNTLAKSSFFKRDIALEQEIKEVEKPKPIEKPVALPAEKPVALAPERPKETVIKAEATDHTKTPEIPKKPEVVQPPKKEVVKEPTEVALMIEDNADARIEVDADKKFILANVQFEQSNPTLKPSSFPQLNKLVKTLEVNPKMKVEIYGHTDNVGDVRANQYLSELRARYIANYLFNKGIAQNRIKYFGKGQENPIAPNDNEDNKKKNRRVEFVLRDN